MKSTYTEETFETYYRELVERHCRDNGMAFRLDEWDGARENMRDDAFVFNQDTMEITGEPAYEDQDLIDEYLYFCLTDDLDDYIETTPFNGRCLGPDDQGDGRYALHVYRDGDEPFSHYDLERMDRYYGTYTFDTATCTYSFTYPVKDES